MQQQVLPYRKASSQLRSLQVPCASMSCIHWQLPTFMQAALLRALVGTARS